MYKTDPIYCMYWLQKLFNKINTTGNRAPTERTLRNVFSKKTVNHAKLIYRYFEALEYLRPLLETIPIRRGKRIYKIPTPINFIRRYKLATAWFSHAVKNKTKTNLFSFFENEINLLKGHSNCSSIKTKNTIYQASVMNRAFIHYRWK